MTAIKPRPGNTLYPNARARILAMKHEELAGQRLTVKCAKCGRRRTAGFFQAREWFQEHECRR